MVVPYRSLHPFAMIVYTLIVSMYEFDREVLNSKTHTDSHTHDSANQIKIYVLSFAGYNHYSKKDVAMGPHNCLWPSQPCLHTFWCAIPPSLYIFMPQLPKTPKALFFRGCPSVCPWSIFVTTTACEPLKGIFFTNLGTNMHYDAQMNW